MIDTDEPGKSDLIEVLRETDINKRMPRGLPPLTTEQINMVVKWMNQGALNNYCSDCDTTDFTFSTGVLPIMNSYCKGCHSSSFPSANVIVTTYDGIKKVVDDGRLLSSIRHETNKQMPQNGDKLEDCKIRTIEKWIADGAKNN